MAGSQPVSSYLPRVLTGLAGAAALLTLAWNPAWHRGFALIVFAAFLLALSEFYDLARKLGFEPDKVAGLILAGLLLLNSLSLWKIGIPAMPWAAGIFTLVVLARPVLSGETYLGFSRLAATFLGVSYVAGLGGYLGSYLLVVENRWTFGNGLANNLVPLLLLTWVFDSASMLSGCTWGKTKLSPASPNKTWEGVAGGASAIILVSVLLPYLGFWAEMGWLSRLGAALVVAPAALIGDLVESALKREAGVKDSANLAYLPGHGGYLDKVDALLFTAPVLWFYLQWVS